MWALTLRGYRGIDGSAWPGACKSLNHFQASPRPCEFTWNPGLGSLDIIWTYMIYIVLYDFIWLYMILFGFYMIIIIRHRAFSAQWSGIDFGGLPYSVQ